MLRLILIIVLLCLGLTKFSFGQSSSPAQESSDKRAFEPVEVWQSLTEEFKQQVEPLIEAHCLDCHDTATQEAKLDLSQFKSPAEVAASHGIWEIVLERVEAGEMPPADTASDLNAQDRAILVAWIKAIRKFEADRNAGDPGPVLARRLSNAEYDYSIRDLTGVAMQPTRSFPVDPANTAGFDNSGESLRMSPALMTKYLDAARHVADHLVMTPDGIHFAPHPVVTDTDRDKYCVTRIVNFYKRQPTDYADYFLAAWTVARRVVSQPLATDPQIELGLEAERRELSPKYLQTVWEVLNDEGNEVGPMAELHAWWQKLVRIEKPDAARETCSRMREFVLTTRKQFEPAFDNLEIDGVHKGSQPFVLWKNKQYASKRRTATLDAAAIEAAIGADRSGAEAELARGRYTESCEQFCRVFPDAFYISERGRDYLGTPKEKQEKGRLLSAGFHSMMGYFRDDGPLCDLILDDVQRNELDSLWQELDFFASAPQRQYQGFLWFDRTDSRFMRDPEFDFARPEDKASLQADYIERLSEVYLAKAERNGGTDIPLGAIRDFFSEINRQIRWVETSRVAAQGKHLDGVLALAARGYRRALTPAEKKDLRQFYNQLREEDGIDHQQAIQDVLVSVLMSPHFLYRVDLLSDTPQTRPLTDIELASRLSYFLWSSMPDAQLLELARLGQLHEPRVLLAETRRMLADPRVEGLATEFGGNWLGTRRFEEHNSVDVGRFPAFNDALRSAMFEEPIRFLTNLLQNDRSTLDLINSPRTFVNSVLASHYGIEDQSFQGDEWLEVSDADTYGRGGLLPMAVFLTKNAPGLRTSPVKRGYWVVRNLLGQRVPPPPPGIPELPEDESSLGELTLRQTLEKHREHASCAVCHDKIDPIGLVFEGFGPVGERRELDLGGRPVDDSSVFPDGMELVGMAELKSYLIEHRQSEFLENVARKLLTFGLGRTLLPSDRALLDNMLEASKADNYRLTAMVEEIVISQQFLNKRGRRTAMTVALSGDETRE